MIGSSINTAVLAAHGQPPHLHISKPHYCSVDAITGATINCYICIAKRGAGIEEVVRLTGKNIQSNSREAQEANVTLPRECQKWYGLICTKICTHNKIY